MYEEMVSIVIPMYNVEKYLEECLQSVTSQTFQNLEIICIDDASTDKTLMIADSIAKRDNRICILKNQSNMGLSYTRNRGMDVANGKYIYFLDSDDMIRENAMQELWDEAENKQLDVIFFDGFVFFEDDELTDRFKGYSMHHLGNYNRIMSGREAFDAMIKNEEWAVNVPREFWNRKFLLDHNIKFENGIIHEDELFSTLSIMQVQRCSVMKNEYFIRRFRKNSIMTSEKSQKNLEGRFKCLCRIIEYLGCHAEETSGYTEINCYLNKMKNYAVTLWLEHSDWEITAQTPMEYAVKKMLELEMYQTFSREDFQKIRTAEKILIYGAGKEGSRILGELIKHKINVSGFAVTDKKDNVEKLWGLEVKECSEWTDINRAVVIIAVKNKKQMDMIRVLLGEYGVDKVVLPQR